MEIVNIKVSCPNCSVKSEFHVPLEHIEKNISTKSYSFRQKGDSIMYRFSWSCLKCSEITTQDFTLGFQISHIFRNITLEWQKLKRRVNDTVERVYEFEFYEIMNTLLDVLDAFENGRRKPLVSGDYNELLQKLRTKYRHLKKNIKYLEANKK